MKIDKERLELVYKVMAAADKQTLESVMYGLIDYWASKGGNVDEIPTKYREAKEA